MKATIVKKLFAGRRWMLWLPVPLLCWSAWPDWQHIPARLLAGLVFWIPFWLAWWLSDGYAGMSRWPGAGSRGPSVAAGVNPSTGKPCTVLRHSWGDTYIGGD